jgi:hypothetical protein
MQNNFSLFHSARTLGSRFSFFLLCLYVFPLYVSAQQPSSTPLPESATKTVITYTPVSPNSMTVTVNNPLAQTIDFATITPPAKIKVKFAKALTSGIVRNGDYVELDTLEDVFSTISDSGMPRIVIPKGTAVFGIVSDRERRFAGFKHGKFKVYLDTVRAVDGTTINVSISRPQINIPKPDFNLSTKERNALTDSDKERNAKNSCLTKGNKLCIAGRVYTSTIVGNLPAALLTAATAGLLTVVKDSKTRIAAEVTLVNTLSSQQGLSAIVNGTDQIIDAGEIFDVEVMEPKRIRVILPTPTPSQVLVCKMDNPPAVTSTKDKTPTAPPPPSPPCVFQSPAVLGSSCSCGGNKGIVVVGP